MNDKERKSTLVEYSNGSYEWRLDNDLLHRTDGPAIKHPDGTKVWWINGRPHRLGAPAFEYANGDKQWWVDGKMHRLDGPAIERADGIKEYYLFGNKYTNSKHYEVAADMWRKLFWHTQS